MSEKGPLADFSLRLLESGVCDPWWRGKLLGEMGNLGDALESSQSWLMGQSVEEAGEAGADASGASGASSSGRVRRRESLPRPPPHTGDWSPLALPLVM